MSMKRISDARARLMMRHRFYGVLCGYMEPTECDSSITATMAVDGAHLFVNPAFLATLDDSELDFVMVHEVSHLSKKHHIRMGGRDPKLWNEACDFAINWELVRLNIGRMPEGGLIDAQFANMGAEEIYSARAQQARQNASKPAQPENGAGAPGNAPSGAPQPGNGQSPSNAPGNGPPSAGKPGNCTPQPGQGAGVPHGMGGIIAPATPAEADQSARDWEVRVVQAAAVAAKQAGTMPGEIARTLKEIKEPAIDCRELLADLIDSRIASDYSFLKPNRRLISQGYYLPGMVVDGLQHLVFAVDTSGSIDGTMLANAANVIVQALESGKVQRLTVVFCDARIAAVQEFESGDEIKLAPKGGGGTRFSPVMDWIEENASDATACIYLTDMECRDFGRDPGLPVYWAIHGDSRAYERLASRAPFGTPLYIGRLG